MAEQQIRAGLGSSAELKGGLGGKREIKRVDNSGNYFSFNAHSLASVPV